MSLPAGSEISCCKCKKKIYKTAKEIHEFEIVNAACVIPLEGIPVPVDGITRVECPDKNCASRLFVSSTGPDYGTPFP